MTVDPCHKWRLSELYQRRLHSAWTNGGLPRGVLHRPVGSDTWHRKHSRPGFTLYAYYCRDREYLFSGLQRDSISALFRSERWSTNPNHQRATQPGRHRTSEQHVCRKCVLLHGTLCGTAGLTHVLGAIRSHALAEFLLPKLAVEQVSFASMPSGALYRCRAARGR